MLRFCKKKTKRRQMVDRYSIDVANPIGHGAFGKIFPCKISPNFYQYLQSNGVPLSFDCVSKLFAVKIQSYDTMFEGQLHLLREIDVLMRTKNYPGTVEIFDFYLNSDFNQAFLILKLADQSLDAYIRSTVDVLKRIHFLPFFCAQMLLHLGYLKHNSIAHRDIKPQNILIQHAPSIFGWTIDKLFVEPQSKQKFFSIDNVKLEESQDAPIKRLCKKFLPMAHNCTCFDSQIEPTIDHMTCKFEALEKNAPNSGNRTLFGETMPMPIATTATTTTTTTTIAAGCGSTTIPPFRIGSCPSKSLFDSHDGMQEDDTSDQERPTVHACYLQSNQKIQSQLKSIPFAYLCDFGLSKHMNKTHHSPYIVTPNFRSPELFDAQFFVKKEEKSEPNKPLTLRSSLQLLTTIESTNSPSSSDPNDISLKREEDSAYNENIDVWGLGCTLAQLVTGKPLFPGKNLETVYSAIRDLLCKTEKKTLKKNLGANQFTLDGDDQEDDNSDDSSKNSMMNANSNKPETTNDYSHNGKNLSQQKNMEPAWITSKRKRAERIRQKVFLQLVANNEKTAQQVCDHLGNGFFDMLALMLDPDPVTRPHAEQLLSHCFVEPFVKASMLLIFTIAADKPQRCVPIVKFSRREDHHWWAFQEGIRADSFEKNSLQLFEKREEKRKLYEYRKFIFAFMLDVVRQTNCRYQTLFSALYHFDRCVANFPRNLKQILLHQPNYNLLAVCCLYLVVRYYERIYLTTSALFQYLELVVDKPILQKFMALFLDSISGQITLPSAWHFVLLCFGELTLLREREFATLCIYKHTLATIFKSRFALQLKKRRKKNVLNEQLLSALKTIASSNNETLAETLRADARTCKKIYTSQFKKHCSRLLFQIMMHADAPYLQHNNRALGEIVFKRCLFNSLFVESFDRLALRYEASFYGKSTVALVKAKF